MTLVEHIEQYSMAGALTAPLRENLAAGFRPAVLVEYEPVREIESAKLKLADGTWVSL